MKKAFDQPELDAVRLFAFCAVFCAHVPPLLPWWHLIGDMGSYGVPLFFFLSAYLLVTLLLLEREATGTVALKAFFVRRVLRIWPLYFGMLAFAVLFGRVYAPAGVAYPALAALALSVGNVWAAQHAFTLNWLGPLWSLSVEEQFYLGIPSLVRYSTRKILVATFVAVIVLAYAVLGWLGHRGAVPLLGVWMNSFVHFQFFAAGGLFAIWKSGRMLRLHAIARIALCGTAFLLWYVATFVCGLHSWTPIATHNLILGYIALLLGTAALFTSALDVKIHIPSPVRYLGKITYGLYVFHNLFLYVVFYTAMQKWLPASKGVRLLIAIIGTLAAAAASYELYEKPFLKLKYRFERIHSRPA